MRKTSFSVKCSRDQVVQLARRLEVVAERLLDDQAVPAGGRAVLGHLLDERADRRRRHGEVVEPVSLRAALDVDAVAHLDEALARAVLGVVELRVAHPRAELVPDVLAELVAGVLLDRVLHRLAEAVVGARRPRRSDDREPLGQQVPEGERVERRHQLAHGQVAGGAEDDDRARLGAPPERQALGERVRGADGGEAAHSADLTAWPPNWLRSAALTFAANDSSCREAKRAKRAAVITGTGTSSAIASAIVQRPSPESST